MNNTNELQMIKKNLLKIVQREFDVNGRAEIYEKLVEMIETINDLLEMEERR